MPVLSNRAVFLSYAREDTDATRRIADALRAADIEVWFDQNELRGGDAWDAKIRKQVKECALFLPIISVNTQARPEGYFRLEWHLAEQRSHLIAQGRPFIVPVCVDDTQDLDALVPDAFLAVQWTRLADGRADQTFCERVKFLLAGGDRLETGHSRAPLRETSAPLPTQSARMPNWVRPVLASAVLVAAVLAITLARRSKDDAPKTSPSTPTAENLSPAREFTRRARQILDQGGLTRAQLDAAEQLCDHALQLDATDALVWATAADVDLRYIYPYGYDRSDERRRRAQEKATRAASLAPNEFEVRLIQAEVFAHAVRTPALLSEAEKTIRALSAARPKDPELVRQLAEVLREQNRFDEAAQLFKSIGDSEVAAWSYFNGGKLRLALASIKSATRSVTALQLHAILEYSANEDFAAAQAVVNQFEPSELLAEMPATTAIRVAMYRGDPERMIELAQGLEKDFLDSNAFRGPRGYFIGLAHHMAGRPAQAESEWRAALAVVQQRLTAAPDDRELLMWAALLHAMLNNAPEAERLFARSQTLAGLKGYAVRFADINPSLLSVHVLLSLRKRDEVLAGLENIFREKHPDWELLHAEMRFGPESEFMRGDPRFQKLLHDYLPEGAQPYPVAAAMKPASTH